MPVMPVAPNSGPTAGARKSRMASPLPPLAPDTTPSRFQSFLERFVIERCGYWPKKGEADLMEAAWEEIAFGRSVYNMIRQTDAAERGK